MVQEVGAASEAQDGIGQLQGEMSRLAQLTGFMEAGRDKKKSHSIRRILETTFWRRHDGPDPRLRDSGPTICSGQLEFMV